jgi:phenylacetate-CoA ligase
MPEIIERVGDSVADAIRPYPQVFGTLQNAKALVLALASGTWSYWKLAAYRRWMQRRWRRETMEQLQARQWARFRRVLAHAYARVPFYRDRLDAAGLTPEALCTPEDARRIPLLTKDDIRQAFPDRIVDRSVPYRPYMVARTSGTTGESTHFIVIPFWIRNLLFHMLSLGHRPRYGRIGIFTTPHCSPYTCSLTRTDLTPRERMASAMGRWPALAHLDPRVSFTSSTRILMETDAYMEKLYDEFCRARPRILLADPVYLGAFARFLRRTGRRVARLQFIMCTYELMTPSVKELLERTFGCPVYSQYGCSEVTDIAGPCAHGRMHLRMDLIYLEVLRDDDTPAAPGELGRVVLTDLRNTVMPLIRYEIGDVVRLSRDPCPCGSKTVGIDTVEGRARDRLRLADGRVLTPLDADAIFRGVPGIDAYRLVQQSGGRYRVSLLARETLPRNVLDDVRARAERLLGDGARVRVRQVHEMRAEGSNKYRFVYTEDHAS